MFLNTDEGRSRIVWGNLPNLRTRRELLSCLCNTYLDPEQAGDYQALLDRLKRLSETRNMIAHNDRTVDRGCAIFKSDDLTGENGARFGRARKYQRRNLEDQVAMVDDLTKRFLVFRSFAKVRQKPRE